MGQGAAGNRPVPRGESARQNPRPTIRELRRFGGCLRDRRSGPGFFGLACRRPGCPSEPDDEWEGAQRKDKVAQSGETTEASTGNRGEADACCMTWRQSSESLGELQSVSRRLSTRSDDTMPIGAHASTCWEKRRAAPSACAARRIDPCEKPLANYAAGIGLAAAFDAIERLTNVRIAARIRMPQASLKAGSGV